VHKSQHVRAIFRLERSKCVEQRGDFGHDDASERTTTNDDNGKNLRTAG
jgi:hypothetical protein